MAAATPVNASSVLWDVIVYGQSISGVLAAIMSARAGALTVLVGGGHAFGGIIANGIAGADLTPNTFGGLVAEVFDRARGVTGQPSEINPAPCDIVTGLWQLMNEAKVHHRINNVGISCNVVKSRIRSMMLDSGETLSLSSYGVVVDASSTADILASVSNSWTIGREPSSLYGESLAGFNQVSHIHSVSPYKSDGTLLPNIIPMTIQNVGVGDLGVMAYTFRPALSFDADRIPFMQPASYDPSLYEWPRRLMPSKVTPLVRKPYSQYNLYDWDYSDLPGASWRYPLSDWAERATIKYQHENYVKGWFYFFANDPSVAPIWREWYKTLGWARSQWASNGHFPLELYVRSGRRLRNNFTMIQSDITDNVTKPNPIAISRHPIDIHTVQMYALPNKTVQYEGTNGPAEPALYQIDYDALVVPDIVNLLMGRCIAASHVADSAVRCAEPMIGVAAGVGAALAALRRAHVKDLGADVSSSVASSGGVVNLS